MAEELTSGSAPTGPAPEPAGQPERESATQSPSSTAAQETTKAPVEQKTQDKPSWYDDPKFRERESARDRALNQAKQEAERAAREKASLQEQLNQYQAQFDQLMTKDMSEAERAHYEAQRARQEAQYYQQQYAASQQQQAKFTVLQTIAEQTGAPLVDLLGSETPDEAWAKGLSLVRNERDTLREELAKYKRAQERDEKEQRNSTDVGGPVARSHDPEKLEQLREAKTMTDLAKLMF